MFKPRRTNAHYLQFIEAVTFYHQYQREKHTDKATGEQFIETTLEDIAEANKLMKEVLLRKADELSGAARNYFEQLKLLLQQNKQLTFTNKEIRKTLRLPGTTVRRYHNELLQNGCIRLQGDKKKKGYLFEIVSYQEYTELQNSISIVLDEILQRLSATAPPVSQSTNGSMKRKAVKTLTEVSQ